MNGRLQILFEDKHFVLINKPAGIHSVLTAKSKELSIAELLIKKNAGFGEAAPKPGDGGLVNRLDCMTSGLLIAAKTSAAWLAMRALLKNGKITKSYLALLEGRLSPPKTAVQTYIGARSRHARKVKVYKSKPPKSERALPAHSVFSMLSYNPRLNMCLCRIEAHLARRHQIRAHAKFLGHPLAGDSLYGASTKLQAVAAGNHKEKLPDFFLQACQLEFTHPFCAKKINIKLDPPNWLSGAFSNRLSAQGN